MSEQMPVDQGTAEVEMPLPRWPYASELMKVMEAAWSGDTAKAAAYAGLMAEKMEQAGQFDQARWLRQHIEVLQGKRQPILVLPAQAGQRDAGEVSAQQALPSEQLAEALADFDYVLTQWARAYPEEVFPEPDLGAARAALEAAGVTLDSVSAAAMRHVATNLCELFEPVRQLLPAGQAAARPAPNGEHAVARQREQSMAMMIRMLCAHTANTGTRQRAIELLRRYGLQGSPLRKGQARG